MIKDYEMCAAAFYDAGWKSTDGVQLKQEYDLTNEEVIELVNGLYEIENDL